MKTAICVQILIIVVLVGYSTYQLFLGNFAASMATFPLLICYYLILVSRQRRK